MRDAVVYHRGTYVSDTDPCFDPLCIWGNEIKHQVRKLRKNVRRKRQMIGITLFIYTLSKTLVNFRMWFPMEFTQDYLANFLTGVEAMKVLVYNSFYHDNGLEVFLNAVKDGREIITRGWTKVVRTFGMEEDTLWVFRFFNTIDSQKDLQFSLHLYRL